MNLHRDRGIALTVWLVLLSVFALFGVVVYLLAWQRMLDVYPHWAVYCLAGISFLRVPAVILMWLWSRVGVLLFISLTLVAIPICLFVGFRLSLLSLIGAAILAFLAGRKWSMFQWRPVLGPPAPLSP